MTALVAPQRFEPVLLKKHERLVRISNTISLLQRKLWNVLLFNAYRELGKKEQFQITMSDLRSKMDWEFGNYQILPDALEGLCQTAVRWGFFDNGGEFGVTTLLSGAKYHEGTITYSFAPSLLPFLVDPQLFGLINIRLSCRLKSKYSLSLYENAVVFIDPTSKSGRSQPIEIADLYELLGASPDKKLRDFKRDCLETAIAEINEKTNITLDVEYDRSGKGRGGKINAALLIVSLKPQQELDLDNVVEIRLNQQIVEKMQGIGVTPSVAMKLATQYDEDYLESKLRLLITSTTPIKSKPSFFVKAVKEDWKEQEPLKQESNSRAGKDDTGRPKKAALTGEDPPEIVWYKSLKKAAQKKVLESFKQYVADSGKPFPGIARLDEHGPLDPHIYVGFHQYLKKNMKKLTAI